MSRLPSAAHEQGLRLALIGDPPYRDTDIVKLGCAPGHGGARRLAHLRLDQPLLSATRSRGARALEDLSRVENFGDTNVH